MVQLCPAWWGRRINQTRKQQTVDNHPHNTPAIPFHPSGDPSSHPAFQQPGGGEGRSYSTRKKKGGQPECGVHPSLRGISSRKDNASLSKLAGTAFKRFSVQPSVRRERSVELGMSKKDNDTAPREGKELPRCSPSNRPTAEGITPFRRGGQSHPKEREETEV